jgi:hypothetical protein
VRFVPGQRVRPKVRGFRSGRRVKYGDSWETQPRNEDGEFGSGGGVRGASGKPAGTRAQGFMSGKAFAQAQATAADKIASAPRPTQADIENNQRLIAGSSRAGGELRGNSTDRAVRTGKLLAQFGNGTTCPCVYCGKSLDSGTLTQDKIYTASQGGRYRMDNLLPACLGCNQSRGDKPLVP